MRLPLTKEKTIRKTFFHPLSFSHRNVVITSESINKKTNNEEVHMKRLILWMMILSAFSVHAADSVWNGDTELDASWGESSNWSIAPAATNRVLIGAGSSSEAPVWLHTASSTNIVWDTIVTTNITGFVTNWVDEIEYTVITNTVEDISSFAVTNIVAGTQGATALLINNGGALRITSNDTENETLLVSPTANNMFQVGYNGTAGTLEIASGAWLQYPHGSTPTFGVNVGSSGRFVFNGGQLVMPTADLHIGSSGEGVLVMNGGKISNSNNKGIAFGYNATGIGYAFITNAVLDSGYHITVGSGGVGYMEVVDSTLTMTRHFQLGNRDQQTSGVGFVDLISGSLSANYDTFVGGNGKGTLFIRDTFPLYKTRAFQVGVSITGTGVVHAGQVTINPQTGSAIIVGENGYGEMHIKGTLFNQDNGGVRIRQAASAFGLLRGYGTGLVYRCPQPLINNGLIIVDGYGEEHDMDFSDYRQDSTTYKRPNPAISTIENDGTNGWYAVNKGRLLIGSSTLATNIVNWCENPDDDEIDMVNSARFVFSEESTWLNKILTGALYAADRSDIPDAEALARRGAIAGVWNFTTTVAEPYTVDAQIRYDHSVVGKMSPNLFWHNGANWQRLNTVELSGHRLAAEGLDSLGWFAVVTTTPSTLLIIK